MTQLARLKPYDGKRHVLRSYTVFGIKFVGERGWYKVDDDVASYLETVRQVESDPDSNAAFDVCTEEEARKIDAAEKAKASRRPAEDPEPVKTSMRVHNVARPKAAEAARAASAAVAEGGDLSTGDLRGNASEEAPDAAPEFSGEFDEDMAAPASKEASEPAPAPPAKPKHKPPTRKPPTLE